MSQLQDPFFSQADILQMQKLQASIASIAQAVNEGQITPDEGEAMRQQAGAMMGPLQQRQQLAQQTAKQQYFQQMTEQNQFQQVMEANNRKFQAAMMPEQQATVYDHHAHAELAAQLRAQNPGMPFNQVSALAAAELTKSGGARHYVQTSPGEWEPVDYPHSPTQEHAADIRRMSSTRSSEGVTGSWEGTSGDAGQGSWEQPVRPPFMGPEEPIESIRARADEAFRRSLDPEHAARQRQMMEVGPVPENIAPLPATPPQHSDLTGEFLRERGMHHNRSNEELLDNLGPDGFTELMRLRSLDGIRNSQAVQAASSPQAQPSQAATPLQPGLAAGAAIAQPGAAPAQPAAPATPAVQAQPQQSEESGFGFVRTRRGGREVLQAFPYGNPTPEQRIEAERRVNEHNREHMTRDELAHRAAQLQVQQLELNVEGTRREMNTDARDLLAVRQHAAREAEHRFPISRELQNRLDSPSESERTAAQTALREIHRRWDDYINGEVQRHTQERQRMRQEAHNPESTRPRPYNPAGPQGIPPEHAPFENQINDLRRVANERLEPDPNIGREAALRMIDEMAEIYRRFGSEDRMRQNPQALLRFRQLRSMLGNMSNWSTFRAAPAPAPARPQGGRPGASASISIPSLLRRAGILSE